MDQESEIERKDNEGHSNRIQFCDWLKRYLNLAQPVDIIWEKISKNIGFFVELNHDVEKILPRLQINYRLVLLTNGGTENQRNKIKQTGLDQFFAEDLIFISEEVGCRKPDASIFHMVQDRFTSNDQFIMIGDHFEKDILAAKKIGWETIHLSPQKKKTDDFYLSISTLSDLIPTLHELTN